MSRRRRLRALAVSFVLGFVLLLWVMWTRHDGAPPAEFQMQVGTDEHFKGEVVVSIIERETGPERFLEARFDLDRGRMSLHATGDPAQSPGGPGSHLDENGCEITSKIPSPAGDAAVYCSKQGELYSISVQGMASSGDANEWSADKGWAIRGLAWSPDSSAVAVLLDSERMDLSPIGVVAMASGHPIPLNTYKVTVLSKQLRSRLDLPVVRRDAPSGWGRLKWISGAR